MIYTLLEISTYIFSIIAIIIIFKLLLIPFSNKEKLKQERKLKINKLFNK